MRIKNLKIGTRLGVAFAAVLALTILIAGTGALRLKQVADANEQMDVAIAKLRLADRWLAGSRVNRSLIEARTRATDAEDLKAIAAKMKDNSADIGRTSEELGRLVVLPEGKAMLAQIAEKRKAYLAVRDEVFALQDGGSADPAQIRKLVEEKINPALSEYDAGVRALSERQQRMADEAKEVVDTTVASGQVTMVGVGVLAVLLGGVLAYLLTRSITVPLRRAVAVANAVAAGDLSSKVEVDSRDEAGELMASLKAMTENLNRLVTQVRSGADTIATAASEVASGNQDLSSRTEEQASSLEESAASLEELTSTVKQNADNALQGNQLASTAAKVAVRGGQVMDEVVQTMGAIDASARQIVDIISVIDGIAFQTNILALNAAVEAARAGEQGRGFAVVAGEVRTLAQRSATAAREIKRLIDDSVEKVGAGTRLVDEAGSTMQDVVASVQRVTDIMAEITAASREQSIGIEQVNAGVTQMDQVTQQNAALVEEAAAATEAMQEQANSLAAAVSVFKLDTVNAPAGAPKKQPARATLPAPARKPMSKPARALRPVVAGADGWEAF